MLGLAHPAKRPEHIANVLHRHTKHLLTLDRRIATLAPIDLAPVNRAGTWTAHADLALVSLCGCHATPTIRLHKGPTQYWNHT